MRLGIGPFYLGPAGIWDGEWVVVAATERFWRGCRGGHVDGVYPDLDPAYCRGFSSVPGPLQPVQRAEMCGVVLALQSSRAVHLGVDNLGVVRHVDRLLRGRRGPKPLS